MEEKKLNLPEEFLAEIKDMLGENFEKYLSAIQKSPSRSLRVNTKKLSPEEFKKLSGLPLKKLGFADDGFLVLTDEKLGGDFAHLAGLCYMQEPSSMLPVIASEIESEAEPVRVLDLCASPGGKTGQIAMRVKEGSIIISNEIVKQRAEVLLQNIERQGIQNVIVTCEAPERLAAFENYFDYVFVDAPCSGEGMFRKNPETIAEWSKDIVVMCSERQRKILDVATKLVRPGGKLIYSTCTFSELEDEQIAEYILTKQNFTLLDVPKAVKDVTLPCNVGGKDYARKFFPFKAEGEGQFVAVLGRAESDEKPKLYSKKHFRSVCQIGQTDGKLVKAFFEENLNLDYSWKDIYEVGNAVYFAPCLDAEVQTALDELKFESIGIKLGSIEKGRFEPNHFCFMALDKYFKNRLDFDEAELRKYLHGEELRTDRAARGYATVCYKGFAVGGAKLIDSRVKNLYPKGLRV